MKPWVYETAWVLGPFTAGLTPGRTSPRATDHKESVRDKEIITTFMCSQQIWTKREKRATDQLFWGSKSKGRSRPWSLLTAPLEVLRRADHLSFLPALTIKPRLPAPPVKGPHHPPSWQEQWHRLLFLLTFNTAGIPIKPSLNFFSGFVTISVH